MTDVFISPIATVSEYYWDPWEISRKNGAWKTNLFYSVYIHWWWICTQSSHHCLQIARVHCEGHSVTIQLTFSVEIADEIRHSRYTLVSRLFFFYSRFHIQHCCRLEFYFSNTFVFCCNYVPSLSRFILSCLSVFNVNLYHRAILLFICYTERECNSCRWNSQAPFFNCWESLAFALLSSLLWTTVMILVTCHSSLNSPDCISYGRIFLSLEGAWLDDDKTQRYRLRFSKYEWDDDCCQCLTRPWNNESSASWNSILTVDRVKAGKTAREALD